MDGVTLLLFLSEGRERSWGGRKEGRRTDGEEGERAKEETA